MLRLVSMTDSTGEKFVTIGHRPIAPGYPIGDRIDGVRSWRFQIGKYSHYQVGCLPRSGILDSGTAQIGSPRVGLGYFLLRW